MSASPTFRPTAPILTELADSGQWNYSDKVTYTQRYGGDYDSCVAAALYKGAGGTVGTDTEGMIVQSCAVDKSRGGVGKLTIVWENVSWSEGVVLPPDEFALIPSDLSPAVEKAPAFNSLSAEHLDWCRKCALSGDPSDYAKYYAAIEALGTPATDLRDVLIRGMTNYYKPAFEYTWTFHTITLSGVTIITGGYRESPADVNDLAHLVGTLGLSCLRKADRVDYSAGLYRVTRTWACAADAYWDPRVYA